MFHSIPLNKKSYALRATGIFVCKNKALQKRFFCGTTEISSLKHIKNRCPILLKTFVTQFKRLSWALFFCNTNKIVPEPLILVYSVSSLALLGEE